MSENEKKVYDALDMLDIPYKRYEHVPVYTIQEIAAVKLDMKGQHCKNLFVRNHNGKEHYLILVDQEKKVDLKLLAKQINSTRLSFASEERLQKYLGLTPGSVTPFGLLNDAEGKITVLIDEDLRNSGQICFHPNVNTASISVSYADFMKFLNWRGNEYRYVKI
ncbi:MAG TPA: prolyl-tRNA synthetase associated domain-containing protein [Clostridia bacterium]|nr:prolyl-tRNA synthetase associated domain-containing protein [Clostridia bacterium]